MLLHAIAKTSFPVLQTVNRRYTRTANYQMKSIAKLPYLLRLISAELYFQNGEKGLVTDESALTLLKKS